MKNFYGEKQDEGRKLKKCMDILCNNKDHNHKNLQFIELYSISLTLQMNTTSVITFYKYRYQVGTGTCPMYKTFCNSLGPAEGPAWVPGLHLPWCAEWEALPRQAQRHVGPGRRAIHHALRPVPLLWQRTTGEGGGRSRAHRLQRNLRHTGDTGEGYQGP